MPDTPDPDPHGESAIPTLYFWPDAPPDRVQDIEEFRAEYELLHGPTDRSRRYITQTPLPERNAFYARDPLGYFQRCPAFLQAYLLHRMRLAASEGRLDNFSDSLIAFYAHTARQGTGGLE